MKLPIPDDWNGKDYICLQVKWPDSPLWQAILTGFLSLPSYGYFWDERSGRITEVQKVGREIFDLNFPYNDCNGKETESKPTTGTGGELPRAIGECLAMTCSIPYGALRWNKAGELEYQYCGAWYRVEGEGGKDKPIDDEYNPPEIEGGGYSACGKAEAVMSMVYNLIQSIWDEVGNIPLQWWGHIKADNPGVHLDAKWAMLAVSGAVNVKTADATIIEYEPDPFDESTWQSVKCNLANVMSDTLPDPMGGNEVRDKLQNWFASEWGVDLLMNAMFVDALRAINRESFEDAMNMGATYDEADCSCPEKDTNQPTEPTANGWYMSKYKELSVTSTGVYTMPICNKLIAEHDTYGCSIQAYWTESPVAGLVPTSGTTAGCSNYDIDAWGNSSDQLQWQEQGTIFAGMVDSVADEVFGVGGWEDRGCLYESSDVQAALVNPEDIVSHGFEARDLPDGATLSVRIRLLYNKNSPSHQ